MNKKVIFLMNTIARGGGAQRVLVNLANQFFENGYNVLLVTSYLCEDEYLINNNIKRITLDDTVEKNFIIRNLKRVLNLWRILKKEEPQLLVSFMSESNYRAIVASMFLNVKVLISVRNDPSKEYSGFIGYLLSRILLPMADGCVFQTEDAKKWFPKKLQNKSKIIYNSVDETFYQYSCEYNKNIIVSLGRLEEQKNYELLIRAFKYVNENNSEVKLLIYGEGSLESKLVNLVCFYGLENNIFFMKNTDNVPLVLSKSGMYVMCSDYEGMPNALMEAMVVGVPCIATDCPCGGPKELINDNVDGILVPVCNEEKLSNAILEALINYSKSIDMGKRAKQKSNNFKPNIIYNEWKNYIDYLLWD